jgi:hypothetical protein
MASFEKGPAFRTPFGRNVFLRSTRDVKTRSWTVAKSTVPAVTIDGYAGQKILQSGVVLAEITSGDDVGKCGPFNADATDGRESTANIIGINNTFLPWQLIERDVEIGLVYECTAVQAWCFETETGGGIVPLTDTTADTMQGLKSLSIMFH